MKHSGIIGYKIQKSIHVKRSYIFESKLECYHEKATGNELSENCQ
jgi:hypothetical protein